MKAIMIALCLLALVPTASAIVVEEHCYAGPLYWNGQWYGRGFVLCCDEKIPSILTCRYGGFGP